MRHAPHIADTVTVSNTATIKDNARIVGNAIITGNATISGNAHIDGNAHITKTTDYMHVNCVSYLIDHVTLWRTRDGAEICVNSEPIFPYPETRESLIKLAGLKELVALFDRRAREWKQENE